MFNFSCMWEKKKCVLIYIYIAFAIKLHICWMLFTIRCMWYMIILEFRKYGGNKEKMLDLLKCASNRNLLSGETLTSGQEPCGLTGTSSCFQPRCLQFKFPVFRYCNYVEWSKKRCEINKFNLNACPWK